VHVDLIKKIIGFVRQQGYKVHTVVTLLEREKTSRQELRELGVELVPFLVYDERTDSADSVLDLEAPEYGVCRKYFKNLQGVD
jgi:orotate phosphoribosyltransferase